MIFLQIPKQQGEQHTNAPRKYDLYYDESQEEGYWHGVLLIPQDKRTWLLDCIKEIRGHVGYNNYLSIKNIKSPGKPAIVATTLLRLVVLGMIQNKTKLTKVIRIPRRFYDKSMKKSSIKYLHVADIFEPIGIKFVGFRLRNFFDGMKYTSDFASKVEITLRMAIKGGLHFLYDDYNQIVIQSIHLDGHEHYRRHIDRERLVGRLQGRLRNYCHIANDLLIDDASAKERYSAGKYEDWEFLQLADLMISSIRLLITGNVSDVRKEVTHPVRLVLEGWGNKNKFRRSPWYKSFVLSEAYIQEGNWKFSRLPLPSDTTNALNPDLFSSYVNQTEYP